MKTRFHLEVAERAPVNAKGLLFPLPPKTHFQLLDSYQLAPSNNYEPILCTGNFQSAVYLDALALDTVFKNSLPSMSYDMTLNRYVANTDHFSLGDDKYLAIGRDVEDLAGSVFASFKESDESSIIKHCCNYLGEAFFYMHHEDELCRAPLSCSHLEGDCLDINTALMKLLKYRGISSAYYIGLFFEENITEETSPEVDDWHCWVSTQAMDKASDWDIAHHIKRQLSPVKAALNPVAGTRMALSHSLGQRLMTPAGNVEVSHFGAPMWVLEDNIAQQAKFTANHQTIKELVC